MIAETSKRKNDIEGAIKFYLKGMAYEPSYLENFLDLAHLSSQDNEQQLCNLILILVKIIQQVQITGSQSMGSQWLEDPECILQVSQNEG